MSRNPGKNLVGILVTPKGLFEINRPLVLQLQKLCKSPCHSITWLWWINMLAIFWLIILIFSYNFQKVEGNLYSFAHVMDDGKLSTSKLLLKSIIESFKERGQVYCVVVLRAIESPEKVLLCHLHYNVFRGRINNIYCISSYNTLPRIILAFLIMPTLGTLLCI